MARGSASIEGIYRRHVQTVYRLCYSYLGSAAEAEDAVQATFMKLVEHPRSFESEDHEKAWLIVAAKNLCLDMIRSAGRSRVVALDENVPEPSTEDEVFSDEPGEVMQAVLRLPEMYKDVLVLHYVEGKKTDEIARMLGSPPSTIRNRLADARALLKKDLEGGGRR
jgi:RNA polymerase sigma-70 factor (ECF subfamily)